jgi:outer membrane protein TolC
MKYLAFTAALLVAVSPRLAAQGTPRDLSLDEALRVAEQNNPDYRSVQTGVRDASARERESMGAFLPQLSTSLSFAGTMSARRVGEDEFGNPLPAGEVRESTRSSTGHGARLGIPLYERGRTSEVKATRADSRAAGSAVLVERGRVRAEVKRRYQDAVRAERLIELEEQLLASARERLDATQRLFRIAAQGMVEVLGAEVEVARQEQAVDQARGDARKAKLALGEVMGTLDVEEAKLTTGPMEVFDPASLGADSLVTLAVRGHPRLAEAASDVAAAGYRVSVARGQRWPKLDASLDYGRSSLRQDYDAFSDFANPFNPFDRDLSFGFSVSLPIFDQFRTSTQVAQADAARTRAQESLRATRLAVEREVRSALIDLQNTFRSSQRSEHAAKLSRDRLEMAREQYRLGAISFTELQQVVDRTAEAERDALRARFEFAIALATLEERVGAPVGA